MPVNEWDLSTKAGVGTVSLTLAVIVLRKLMTFLKNEGSMGAGASAVEAQFTALRNQIKAQDERYAAQEVMWNARFVAQEERYTLQETAWNARFVAQEAKIAMLLLEQQRQDTVIHRQQTKLTRTEMLVRQLVGLVQESAVSVPGYIQAELDELIKDRDPNAKTRESDK